MTWAPLCATTEIVQTHTMAACAICLELCDAAEATSHTLRECGHTFHTNCLVEWLRQSPQATCPTCRSTAPVSLIGGATLLERARFLRRTVARRRNAPGGLVRLVQSVRSLEGAQRNAVQTLRAFEREHRDVLSMHNKLRQHRWTCNRAARRALRLLGTYASPECPLPPLLLGGNVHRSDYD